MSVAPSKYTRNFDFNTFQTANPTTPLPGDYLESELNELKAVTDAIIDRLAEVQRADGAIANLSVGPDQLSIPLSQLFDAIDANLQQAGVSLWNGRAGAVIPQAGDYSATLISFSPVGSISSNTVQAAIAELEGDLAGKSNVGHTHVAADITDSTAAGRALLTSASASAQFTTIKQAATTAATGVVELATQAEQNAFTAGVVPTADLLATHSAQGLQSKWIPARDWAPTITNGARRTLIETVTNDLMVDALIFDGAVNQNATFDWAPPKQYNEGTLTFMAYWQTATGTAAQTVIFNLSGISIGDNELADGAPGTAVASSDALQAVDRVHISPLSAAITLGGTPADTELVQLKVTRNAASDTHAGDVLFLGAMIFYTTNAGRDN